MATHLLEAVNCCHIKCRMGYYLKTIHIQWFIYFSSHKWTEEIIGINEAGDVAWCSKLLNGLMIYIKYIHLTISGVWGWISLDLVQPIFT